MPHYTPNDFNRLLGKPVPIKHNYTFEGHFPEIRPPAYTASQTEYGDCIVIAGTESFQPVTVNTSSNAYPHAEGDIIHQIAFSPLLMEGTRLAKLASNYEKWYPRRLVLEYVPQGSALDVGALISIPILDPAETFVTIDGITAVRRALAYDKSRSFNIFDSLQFLLPEVEEQDPYFVSIGDDARLEISHVWYCMAQSGFPARNDETTRTIGWFKLHYVVELYEPRIPELDATIVNNLDAVLKPVLEVFSPDRNTGDPIIGSETLFAGILLTEHHHMFKMQVTAEWIFNAQASLEARTTEGAFIWTIGKILYARIIPDAEVNNTYFYSNLADMFDDNDRLIFNQDYTNATNISGRATLSPIRATG